MPSSLTHAAAGAAIAAWLGPLEPSRRRVIWTAAFAAAAPDLDLIGWPLGVPDDSLFAHRALSHSIPFALAAGALLAALVARSPGWTGLRVRLAMTLSLAVASHGLLDSLTTYGWGVELWAPFTQHRYRLYPLISDIEDGRWAALRTEFLVVFLPLLGLLWLGLAARRPESRIRHGPAG